METMERLSTLKKHETDCYSICYYLLQCDKTALEAAQKALCNLIKCDLFFVADAHTVRELLRKESIQSSLQIKKNTHLT
ncbi:hypothetical protein [Paenibacillus validus]|uniref:Uncharacterized protein n=1 Tax=Paenibacillus validus TaxID=44253 RepID=A0A7X2ZAX9_9BACL|nr:hypothetical protein [Paenibacillus validus]MUG71578.1 hypothetical protein [Paenibacillus validus]